MGEILLMEETCTSWYGESTTIYKVLYIPGGAGFLPSTVGCDRHQLSPSYKKKKDKTILDTSLDIQTPPENVFGPPKHT